MCIRDRIGQPQVVGEHVVRGEGSEPTVMASCRVRAWLGVLLGFVPRPVRFRVFVASDRFAVRTFKVVPWTKLVGDLPVVHHDVGFGLPKSDAIKDTRGDEMALRLISARHTHTKFTLCCDASRSAARIRFQPRTSWYMLGTRVSPLSLIHISEPTRPY